MSTRVFLLRHAESAQPNVFHGAESDVGLSERGRQQAEAVARELLGYSPQVVISSAMRRARDTAMPIARALGLTVLMEPDLHERKVGALSGVPFHGNEVWPQTVQRWMAGDTAYAPDDAESFDAIRNRVLPVWHRLTDTHAGKTLVVVAHGTVNKVLLLSILPDFTAADWQRIDSIPNVGLQELVLLDKRWQAVRLNYLTDSVREGHQP